MPYSESNIMLHKAALLAFTGVFYSLTNHTATCSVSHLSHLMYQQILCDCICSLSLQRPGDSLCGVIFGCSGFHLQSKDMHARESGNAKLAVDVSWSDFSFLSFNVALCTSYEGEVGIEHQWMKADAVTLGFTALKSTYNLTEKVINSKNHEKFHFT